METFPLPYVVHYQPLLAVLHGSGGGAIEKGGGEEMKPTGRRESEDMESFLQVLQQQPGKRTTSLTTHARRSSMQQQGKSSGTLIPFEQLIESLLSALRVKSSLTLWEASKTITYRVLAFNLDHRFTKDEKALSPLNPNSPLHPDGLMHHGWILRYLEQLPAVAIAVFPLWDAASNGGGAGEGKPRENEKDGELVTQILEYKQNAQEVNVKLSVLILLRRSQLGDASVEDRLIAIRRACQLDPRSGFFALAPCDSNELANFVSTLYKNLYEPVMTHYKELYRKTKKKRQSITKPPHSLIWQVRGEFKMAVLSEIRHDYEAALKHYESAHALLAELLHTSTKTVEGKIVYKRGTPRWDEAIQLSEIIHLRICRIHLYNESASDTLSQHRRHLSVLRYVFEDRGVSSSHFEYLGWISKQYRLFGDLVDLAIRNGYKLPALPSGVVLTTGLSLVATGAGSDYRPFSTGFNPSPASGGGGGVNPNQVLQHPGFYYLAAASHAAERRRAFQLLESGTSRVSSKKEDPMEAATVRALEREVDHASLAVELLTKSYEHFKKQRHGRMTLYLASEIAQEYFEGGKFDMALKFFDRIAKNYRKEKWHSILGNILRRSLECARRLVLLDRAIEYLVELLSENIEMTEGERAAAQQELMDFLYANNNGVKTEVLIDMDQLNSFITCEAVFPSSHGFLTQPIAFQVHLMADRDSPPMPLEVAELLIEFNDPSLNHRVLTKANESRSNSEVIDIHQAEWKNDAWEAQGDLMLSRGSEVFVEGAVKPKGPGELKINAVSVFLRSEGWNVQLLFKIQDRPFPRPSSTTTSSNRWLLLEKSRFGNFPFTGSTKSIKDARKFVSLSSTTNNSITKYGLTIEVGRVTRKQPKFDIKAEYDGPAYLDERFPIHLHLHNSEAEGVQVYLGEADTRLLGSQAESPGDQLSFLGGEGVGGGGVGGVEESGLKLANLFLGVVGAGASSIIPIYFTPLKYTGERVIRFKIRYRLASSTLVEDFYDSELIRQVSVVEPFETEYEAYPIPLIPPIKGKSAEYVLPGLPRVWDVLRHMLLVKIKTVGPWDVEVADVSFELQPASFFHLRLVSSSTAPLAEGGLGFHQQVWTSGQVYHLNIMLELAFDDSLLETGPLPDFYHPGRLLISWRRLHHTLAEFHNIAMDLPPLSCFSPDLTVIPEVPAYAHTDEPFTLCFRVWNRSRRTEECLAQLETEGASATSSADTIGFVYAGYKQAKFRVAPLSEFRIYFNIFPVKGGRCKLPRLKVERKRTNGLILVTGKEVWVGGEDEERIGENVGVLFVKPKLKFED